MPVRSTLDILKDARANRYAVGAFNIDNLDMAKGIIAACEELKAPVIIQTTYTTVNHAGAQALSGMVRALAEESRADISLHLDHGNTYDIAVKCIDCGYTSVMYDGSKQTLYKNIELTKQVVDYARLKGVPVEGELGRVGGIEDEVTAESSYTDVNECVEFVDKTDVDFIAIGVGTAHGIYLGEPKINIVRIGEIFNAVKIPLVLHGASGLSEETVKDCIASGISKINFATEVRMAYTAGVRTALKDESLYDPKKYQLKGREKVAELVKEKLQMIGY